MANKEIEELVKQVAGQDWAIEKSNGHYLAWKDGVQVTIPSTPSSPSTITKTKSKFRRHGAIIDGRGGGPDKEKHEATAFKERKRRSPQKGGHSAKVREVLLHADRKLSNEEIRELTGIDDRRVVAGALGGMENFGDIAKERIPGKLEKLYWLKGKRFDVPVVEPEPVVEETPEDASDKLYKKLVAATIPVEKAVEVQGVAEANGAAPSDPWLKEMRKLRAINEELSSENRRLSYGATPKTTGLAGLPSEFWEHLGKAIAALGTGQ